MATERTYYWEHSTDPSRFLRGSARDMASVQRTAGGEVGVIIDDGGPLRVVAVTPERTVRDTVAALRAAE